MKLLVTGASGFLGQRVVAHALAAGHSVRAVVRPATAVGHLPWAGLVDVFRADLRGGADLLPAFDGIDALIHLAAGMDGTDEQRFQATVAGTERLLDAMKQSETRRLVLASSFYVYDWSRIRRVLTEESAVHRTSDVCDGYTTAKLWQERVVRQMAQRQRWDLVVLRPGFIWGRGAELPPRVGLCLGRSVAVVGPWSDAALTHVDNCADYFVKAAAKTRLTNATLNVIDGHRVRSGSYARDYLAHRSPDGWRLPVPYFAGYSVACAAKLVSRLIFGPKGRLPSLFVPQSYQKRFRPMRFSTKHLYEALGKPKHSFAECLRQTFGAEAPNRPRLYVPADIKNEPALIEGSSIPQRTHEEGLLVANRPLSVTRSVVHER